MLCEQWVNLQAYVSKYQMLINMSDMLPLLMKHKERNVTVVLCENVRLAKAGDWLSWNIVLECDFFYVPLQQKNKQ